MVTLLLCLPLCQACLRQYIRGCLVKAAKVLRATWHASPLSGLFFAVLCKESTQNPGPLKAGGPHLNEKTA